ncbi:hypothetical protein K450DRAFT_231213 [Umbelopsis ramanniana AG]|uniref:Uncharacterized protein n=1 Tax=Umbelopsis ramanniana AG TaxID=1314678 RepID=A0AAD5EDA5_UMBRA|nr:uncharacterized protein K450DRAFT_231213 [Umbelopsis ramanniana AG]KAI8581796.1 hypothetical protein K450DRAFT_231213 [Umbelopsis ramanniana AG]
MANIDHQDLRCRNFRSTFSADRLRKSEDIFRIHNVRDRHIRSHRQPYVQKTVTTTIPTSIMNSCNGAQQYEASIQCSHIHTFHATLQRWQAQPTLVTNLLLLGLFEEEKWDSANIQGESKGIDVIINITLTVNSNYMQDSFTLGDIRCMKSLWRSWVRDGMMHFTGLYFAVLGGAYSSLAKANSRYALKAGSLAIRQIQLAQKLNDTVQECKCWLYYAEDLIHLGKLAKARRILRKQYRFAYDNQNELVSRYLNIALFITSRLNHLHLKLEKMCQSVDNKLKVAEEVRKSEDMQTHLVRRMDSISI